VWFTGSTTRSGKNKGNAAVTRFAAIAAAAVLAYGFSSIPAFAGMRMNGPVLNGFNLNGVLLNGLSFNGMRMNGAAAGAVAAPAPVAITLADGTVLSGLPE